MHDDTGHADHEPHQQPRDLDHLQPQPGRQRVRHRDRLLPLMAQEPPAELRLERGRHRPQPQLELAVGLLRRLQRHVLVGDLPRRVGVLGARDRSACATSSTAAWSAARSRSRPTSTSTPTPSSSCGRTATRPPTPRPGSPPTTRPRSRSSAATWPRRTATRPSRRQDLYIADGTIDDWGGASTRSPPTRSRCTRAGEPGFYPPGSIIARETSRNRAAVLQLLEAADCLYEVIGQSCGPVTPPLYWTTSRPPRLDGELQRHRHRDHGPWQRSNPADTNSSGVKQLDATIERHRRPRDGRRAGTAPATSTSTAA